MKTPKVLKSMARLVRKIQEFDALFLMTTAIRSSVSVLLGAETKSMHNTKGLTGYFDEGLLWYLYGGRLGYSNKGVA